MQFLSSVDDHVSLKVSLLCETLPALITMWGQYIIVGDLSLNNSGKKYSLFTQYYLP